MTRINHRRIYLFLIILIFPLWAYGQFFKDLAVADTTSAMPENQKYGLRFNSYAFFKNNEYFHPLVEGYTLPGFLLQPRLFYEAGDKFSLEAGVHMSQFSGKEGLNDISPLFSVTYNATRKFSIILGSIKGTTYHQLIEPLFQWERMYTNPLEYGVQFLYSSTGIKLDTWIDWEKYIELNDPFQEELSFGTTSKARLLNSGNIELWIPLQATVKHKGGQVTTVDLPLQTIANWATGVNLSISTSSLVKKLLFDIYYVGYSDFSPQKLQRFKNGYGLYPVVSANIHLFQASLGYWYGHHFIASKGEPLFQSVSPSDPHIFSADRQVVTFKASFYKKIFENVSFGAYAESYYDTKLSQMDYAYGIAITASGEALFSKKQAR